MEEQRKQDESLGEATDFFTMPPLMMSEEESYLMKIHPVSSTQNEAPIIYEFEVDDNHYVDMSQTYHYVTFKIMKGDRRTEITATGNNNTIANEERVCPINYFGNTAFSNVELYLNNELIESSNNLYPYKSYIKAFLSNSRDEKDNQMAASFYYEDTDGIDTLAIRGTMDDAECSNEGMAKRFALSQLSKPFTTFSPLHLDFCAQSRYVQNKTSIKIRLSRAKPEFALIARLGTQNYSIVIQESYLLVRMVRPRESLRLAVEEAMENSVVKYPLKSCEMRFFTNAGTSNTISEPNLYSGHLPTRVAIGIVKTDALDGTYITSPFKFQHFNVNEIDLKVNGKSITTDPMKVNIDNDDYVLPYTMMYRSTGGFPTNEALISYKQYKEGFFIYVFDLTEDQDHDGSHFHTPKSGILSLDLRVNQPPGAPVSIIVMLEKEILITCDKNRSYAMVN